MSSYETEGDSQAQLVRERFTLSSAYAEEAWGTANDFINSFATVGEGFDIPFSSMPYSPTELTFGEYSAVRPTAKTLPLELPAMPGDPVYISVPESGASIAIGVAALVEIDEVVLKSSGYWRDITVNPGVFNARPISEIIEDVPISIDFADSFNPASYNAPPVVVKQAVDLRSAQISIRPSGIEAPDKVTIENSELVVLTDQYVKVPFTAVAPTINIQAMPQETYPVAPGAAPVLTDPSLPTKPIYSIPVAPKIQEIVISSSPEIQFPSFDGVEPFIDLEPPVGVFVYEEAAYESDTATNLNAWFNKELTEMLKTGGELNFSGKTQSDKLEMHIDALVDKGIGTNVEIAMWNRAIAKNEIQNEAMYDEANEYFASRGWTLPPGALSGRLLEIQKEQARQRRQMLYEIMTQQFEIIQRAKDRVITGVLENEKHLYSIANSVATRAFESAKYIQDAAIVIFNAAVAKFGLDLQKYATMAQVFESKTRAAMLDVERYKIEMEGKRIVADIQKINVEIYGQQVEAVNTVIKVYTTEMETARIQLEMNRSKIENYVAQINAYSAMINAITSKYDAYQKNIDAEKAKVELYSEQVKAFATTIEADRIENDINNARGMLQLKQYELNLMEYSADTSRYEARVKAYQAESDTLKSEEEIYINRDQLKIEDAKATTDHFNAMVNYYDAEIKAYSASIESEKTKADISMGQTKLEIDNRLVSIQKAGMGIEKFNASVKAFLANIDASRLSLDVNTEKNKLKIEQDKVIIEKYNSDIEKSNLGLKEFLAKVEASKVSSENDVAFARLKIEQNQYLVEKFRADIDRYKADILAKTAEAENLARTYGYETDVYDVDVRANIAKIEASIKAQEAKMQLENNQLQIKLKEAEVNIQSAIQTHQINVESIRAGGNISAQLAASALNSVNASASYAYSGGKSVNKTEDDSRGVPTTSYIYNYGPEDAS